AIEGHYATEHHPTWLASPFLMLAPPLPMLLRLDLLRLWSDEGCARRRRKHRRNRATRATAFAIAPRSWCGLGYPDGFTGGVRSARVIEVDQLIGILVGKVRAGHEEDVVAVCARIHEGCTACTPSV